MKELKMKTYLLQLKLILIVLLFASAVNAQIILNSDRKPVVGDSFTTSNMDTTGVTEGASGSNITWDFSNVTASGQQLIAQYLDPSEAPGDSLFPDADVTVNYDELSYSFYDTESNTVHSLGMAFEDFSIVYLNTEKVAEYPFTFNSTFLDNFQSQYELGEGLIVRNIGITQFIGDGFGNIILPDGSNHAALRVKIFRQTADTMFVAGFPLSTTEVKATTYEWYTNESKYPVFGISYFELNINGSITSYKQVDYNTGTATDVNDESPQIVNEFELFQNYPNPFNPSTKITWQSTLGNHQTLKVYNVLGTEVATLVDEYRPAGNYEVEFDASKFSSGVYLYSLQSGSETITKKMTLIK
jgi:hypothetical protein